MSKKYTQEYVSKLLSKYDYKLLNKYVNNRNTLFIEDKEGYVCTTCLNSFKKRVQPSKFHSSNPYTIQNIKLWMKTNAIGYELFSTEYKNAKEELLFQCPKCGEMFNLNWSDFKQGKRCGVCTGRQVTLKNCIATTDPWMIDLGMSIEDAKNHTYGSEEKVIVTCPYCKKQKRIKINQIYNKKSIGCTCGDGISYNEKFIIAMFNQLNIKYIKEYKPEWSNNKRYDFYFEYNDKKRCIIECNGEQHYKESFSTCGGRTLKEEQENDKYKKELAENNGISDYIILDCSKSNFEQIKNSILNSKLVSIFDLQNIDWLKCEEFALSNRVKEVCDYWNNKKYNETTTTVGRVFNLDKNTICKYLKKGQILNWCNYKVDEESTKIRSKNGKSNGKPIEIFRNGKSLGVFPSCSELERQSEELFGVKLLGSCISAVCTGRYKQYKGFFFKHINRGVI